VGVTRREAIAFGILLAAGLCIQLWQCWDTGITVDEPNHMLAAHFYWDGGKVFHVPDLAPLLKITSGWIPRAFGYPIPPSSDQRWATRDEWLAGTIWIGEQKDPFIRWLTFHFRCPMLLFPLLTALLLWYWARSEWGGWTGVFAAALFLLEPTALAHGSLVKNDVASAFGYLAFWFAAWRFWRSPCWLQLAGLTLAALTGVLAKLSLILLAGIGPVLILFTLLYRRSWWRIVPYLMVFAAANYLGLCAAYLWDVRLLHPLEVERLLNDPRIPWLFAFTGQIFQWIPVPQYFWEGCVGLLWNSAARSPVYFFGQVLQTGHPLYFLGALAVKVPIGLQLLFLAAGGFCAWRIARQRDLLAAFLLFPPLLYIGLASLSGLQLGIRLILPALPFAVMMAARLMKDWKRPATALAVLGIIECAIYIPRTMAFFNLWAGGPANGIRYLADSNLDWGQDLRRLWEYQQANRIDGMRISYFGMDSVWRYFTGEYIEPMPPPWSAEHTKGKRRLELEPGHVYAISATLLPGHFFRDEYQNYYQLFRDRRPDARAGWSILIYDLRKPTSAASPPAPDPKDRTSDR
jgi:hypothetical protein